MKLFLIAGNVCSLTILVMAISTAQVKAENPHYRWLDDRGNPVHSDRPPEKGVDYEVVSTESSLKRVVSNKEGAVPAEITPRAGNEFEQADSAPDKGQKNAQYCQRARTNLQSIDSVSRIRIRDKSGEFRYLSDEEKATERQKAIDAIEVHCE